MKIYILILSLILASSSSAQKNVSVKELIETKENAITFNCGGGPTAGTAVKFSRLKEQSQYAEIRKLILSKNPSEKFFAAICCIRLTDVKKISLTGNKKKLVADIYDSNEVVYSCFGCNYMKAKSIKEYLNSKDDERVISQINLLLDKLLE